jgi:zinc protease
MTKSRRFLAVLLAVFAFTSNSSMPLAAVAAETSTEAKVPAPTIKYEKYTLPNGLDVILSEDHRLPMVSVNLWYHVGPANERPGLTGFAHLFEHMMFEGSKNVGPKSHFKYLESAGASTINGTTDFDRTNYFETVPSNQLELALWLESDRMGFLLGTLDQEKLANQRDVVRNERRQSFENTPYGLVEEGLYHELFPKEHPYYASVIGSHEDIEAVRLKDVRDFFKQYYSPNNCSVAIVGDFNKADAKELVQKYFGSIPKGPDVPKIEAKTPPITAQKRVTITDQVELPRVYMGWLTPPIFKAGDAEADLIAHILGKGKSSRLYRKLVYEKQIAQDVSADNSSLTLGSIFSIQATAKAGVKLEEIEKVINEELAAFRKDGPTQKELDGARNSIESSIIRQLESLGGFGGVADRLNKYNHFLQNPGYLAEDLARYENATVGGLKQIADKYLTDNSDVIVYGLPGKKVIADVPRAKVDEKEVIETAAGFDEPWRKTPPQPGPLSKISLPIPTSFKLDNGLTVYLAERHELPVVAMSLVTLSGAEHNPLDKPGLSSFTADMLDEGTKTRSTMKIAEELDQLGARVHTNGHLDANFVSLNTLKKTLTPALEIFSDVALNPAFDAKEMDRVRNERVTSIKQDKDNPSVLARRALRRTLYGVNHPYGYETDGTVQSNQKFTPDDLLSFYKDNYTPSNTALAIAGDVTPEEAKNIAEKYFGSWKGDTVKSAKLPDDKPVKRAVFIVNKPDAPQTVVRVGGLGIARSSPDYASGEIANNGLGGMFSSRLNMNLREKHGYTYGAFSSFDSRRGVGPFVAGASLKTDVTAPGVTEFFREIDGMRSNLLSPAELKMAKDNWALSLPGMFETSPSVAGSIAGLFVYDLPLDYYKKLPGQIDAVTPKEVEDVSKKYFKPEEMVIVTVGDKAKIKPELEKLNLGPIIELDIDGNPVESAASLEQPTNK